MSDIRPITSRLGPIQRTALLSVLFSIGGIAGCSRGQPPADAAIGQRVADAFLAQVRAGLLDAAWQSTSAEFKSDEGRESFIRDIKSKPALSVTLSFLSYEITDLNGLKRGQCLYASPAGSKTPAARVRIVVGKDSGEWKVDGLFVE